METSPEQLPAASRSPRRRRGRRWPAAATATVARPAPERPFPPLHRDLAWLGAAGDLGEKGQPGVSRRCSGECWLGQDGQLCPTFPAAKRPPRTPVPNQQQAVGSPWWAWQGGREESSRPSKFHSCTVAPVPSLQHRGLAEVDAPEASCTSAGSEVGHGAKLKANFPLCSPPRGRLSDQKPPQKHRTLPPVASLWKFCTKGHGVCKDEIPMLTLRAEIP